MGIITAYTTDGRSPGLNLVPREDDKGFLPPYNPAPILKRELMEQYPDIADALNQLSGAISEDEMADMNYQVDVAGEEPTDVARAFLGKAVIVGGDKT